MPAVIPRQGRSYVLRGIGAALELVCLLSLQQTCHPPPCPRQAPGTTNGCPMRTTVRAGRPGAILPCLLALLLATGPLPLAQEGACSPLPLCLLCCGLLSCGGAGVQFPVRHLARAASVRSGAYSCASLPWFGLVSAHRVCVCARARAGGGWGVGGSIASLLKQAAVSKVLGLLLFSIADTDRHVYHAPGYLTEGEGDGTFAEFAGASTRITTTVWQRCASCAAPELTLMVFVFPLTASKKTRRGLCASVWARKHSRRV